jgi:nitrogen regulatory protein PII
MKEIKALVEPSRLYDVVVALRGVPSMPRFTVSEVRAFPAGGPGPPGDRQPADSIASFEMYRIECVVPDSVAHLVVDAIERADRTGVSGRETVIVVAVEEAVKAGAAQQERGTV